MYLSDNEKKMLDGEHGRSVRKAMEILTALGEIYDAQKMVPISSVHMPGSSIVVAGESGLKFAEEMSAGIDRLAVFTTLNPNALDEKRWRELKITQDEAALQLRLTEVYKKMGALACHNCTPYFIGNISRLGQHLAWGESSATVFANSVMGAKTNREGGPSALACAITGLAPAYGYHLDHNRKGQLLINFSGTIHGSYEYGQLGYYVGSLAGDRIPVFTGIPPSVTLDELKYLGSALASSGAVALYHVVGVTPEAPTLEAAFQGDTPTEVYNIGKQDIAKVDQKLNNAPGNTVDWVYLGCPFISIQEYAYIASLLKGKKLNSGVDLWVATSESVYIMAKTMGYADIVESAGARNICSICPVLTFADKIAQRNNFHSITTDSAKMAHYMPGQFNILTRFGSTRRCIEAAVSGYWE